MFKPFKALITALFLATTVVGQTQQPALKPANQTRTPEPTPPLKLEVRYNPELPPAYLDVRGPTQKPTWIWVTRFVKKPGSQDLADELPVRAVRFETQFNGETTDVRVTVLRGKKGFEREDLVGLFKLGLGDSRLLSELASFQVEPIYIAISDGPFPLPLPPALEVRVGAVEIVSIESEGTPLPAYRILFRNVSQKNIAALQVFVVNGPIGLLRGVEGRPLIEPGELHQQYLPLPPAPGNTDRSGKGNIYTVVVSSAVFEDGTYEGAVAPACTVEKAALEKSFWLKSVIPILGEQLTENNSVASVGAAHLKERINQLKVDVPQALVIKPSRVSQSCSPPGAQIELLFNSERLQLLRTLDLMISNRPAPPIDFMSWLRTTRDRYENWLSRLSENPLK